MVQASGRSWKEAGQRAGTLRSQNVSSSWDEKMRIKAETKMFRENRAAAIATRKAKLQVCPMVLPHQYALPHNLIYCVESQSTLTVCGA